MQKLLILTLPFHPERKINGASNYELSIFSRQVAGNGFPYQSINTN